MKTIILILALELVMLSGCATNPYYQAAKAYICEESE
jgi:hypothetical protein